MQILVATEEHVMMMVILFDALAPPNGREALAISVNAQSTQ